MAAVFSRLVYCHGMNLEDLESFHVPELGEARLPPSRLSLPFDITDARRADDVSCSEHILAH